MDDISFEDDPEAAAMAEAMGFSGFGSQRPAKRKFNANADAAVDVDGDLSTSGRKKGGNVSKTGANSAPLGARRQLPLASASLPARPSAAPGFKDADEIDLGEEDDDDDDDGVSDAIHSGFPHATNVSDGSSGPLGAHLSSNMAQPQSSTVIDNGPPGLPARPSHHSRGQSQQRGRGGRGRGGHGSRSSGGTGAPWWEGYYDARINENPWEKLERERGLQPRGIWPSRSGGHGRAAPGSSEVPPPDSSHTHGTDEAVANDTIESAATAVDTNTGARDADAPGGGDP